MYKIIVSKEGEPYKDSFDHERRDWQTIYEQSMENLDVNALVIYLNSLPKKRSYKRKDRQMTT